MASKRAQYTDLRMILTVYRNGKAAGDEDYDITEYVVELGPLSYSGGGYDDRPRAESIRLRLFGDEGLNPRKSDSVFGECETVYLDIYKDGTHVFFGVMSSPPRLEESAEFETTTLHFVGGLRELWPQQIDYFVNEDIEYADPEHDLWPLLQNAVCLPVSRSSFSVAPIETTEDVWSATGRPRIELPEYTSEEIAKWDLVSPAYCETAKLVYAGFGPFILSYDLDSGTWETIAVISGDWIILHLEYDFVSGEIFGVAAKNEEDITKRAAHTRMMFTWVL